MSIHDRRRQAASDMVAELYTARAKFGPMVSLHEGFAITQEEWDEVWEIVKQKQSGRDHVKLRQELVQVGAMVIAMITEIVEEDVRR